MKRTTIILLVLMILGIAVGCDDPGTVINTYQDDDYKYEKVVMPDGAYVWVAKSKNKPSMSATSRYDSGAKTRRYTIVIESDAKPAIKEEEEDKK